MELTDLGWSAFFEEGFREFADTGLRAARVVLEHRGGYRVCLSDGEQAAEVPGRFRRETLETGDYPAVGDWVAVEEVSGEAKCMIHAVLPRQTKFSRTGAGKRGGEQVIAANIDDLFVVSGPNSSLNPRRVERYLALAWESGAKPVVLLAKADLSENLAADLAKLEGIGRGVVVLAASSVTGAGFRDFSAYLQRGRTAALVGPSGVGKSTLINRLCGREVLRVQSVRDADQKGRHTTSQRQLIILPGGGLIIDTPGMRELRLWEGSDGVGEVFSDIEDFAARCRFSNCRHETEPGCAVLGAIEAGSLDLRRLESHRKLRLELEHFEKKHDKRAPVDQRRRWKSVTKHLRSHYKIKR